MAVLECFQILFLPLCIFLVCFHRKSSKPTNWPLVGMLPAVVRNRHRLHDYITEVLIQSGGTFEFKGPLFSNMDMLVTCDPSNIEPHFHQKILKLPKGTRVQEDIRNLGRWHFRCRFRIVGTP